MLENPNMNTSAVILPPTAMSFQPVAGLPLIQRIALSALRGGFTQVIAVAGADGARLAAALAADPRTRAIPVVHGGVARAVTGERVTLLPSDCLVTAATLQRVRAVDSDNQVLLFPADVGGRGEHGILVGPREAVLQSAHAAPSPMRMPLGDEICLRITDAATAALGERRLCAHLRATAAASDGPVARFDRALSTRLSRLLVRTPLRPNHITFIGTAVGLLAAWCFAQGRYAAGLLGAVLFWAAIIIDGCDGEVARLKFQETRFGSAFDVVTDNMVHAAIFLGLGIGQSRAVPDHRYAVLLILLLGGFACALLTGYVCLMRHSPVQLLQPQTRRGRIRQRLLRGFEALMNRDFAYVLLVLAACNRLDWFLWGAAFGSYAVAAGLLWVYRWSDAA